MTDPTPSTNPAIGWTDTDGTYHHAPGWEPRRATGAIVTERQRCICPDLCLEHCRACNHSGRDLEEMCIADPDWEPDDADLARRASANTEETARD